MYRAFFKFKYTNAYLIIRRIYISIYEFSAIRIWLRLYLQINFQV